MNDGHIFGERASDAIDGGQFADSESGHDATDPFNARITIGRIGGVKLIAVTGPR